jgi:hypothetical protein
MHRIRIEPMRTHAFVNIILSGRPHGIVGIGNVVKNRTDELEAEHSAMADYVTGER